jgi:hypothetical protein
MRVGWRRPSGSWPKGQANLHARSLLLSQSPRSCCSNRKISTTSLAFAGLSTTLPGPCSLHRIFTRRLAIQNDNLCPCSPLFASELPAGFGTHEQLWRQVMQPLPCQKETVAPTSLRCPHKRSGTVIVARSAGSILLRTNLYGRLER